MTEQHGAAALKSWELEALTRLDEVAGRFARAGEYFEACLGAILEAAIFVARADKGNLQLLDPSSGCLVIRAQRGFSQPFLDFFSYVDADSDSACGAALIRGQRTLVEDVKESEIFVGTPGQDVLLKEHVRAVQSTPLKSSTGYVVGILSTHFSRPTHMGELEEALMDVLARQAADYIERKQTQSRKIAELVIMGKAPDPTLDLKQVEGDDLFS